MSTLQVNDIQNSLGTGKPTVNSETIITAEASQTITGQKTFTAPIKVADAVNADEALNKGQLLTEITLLGGADLLGGYKDDDISYASTRLYNTFFIIINGELYSTSGNSSSYSTYCTGRYYGNGGACSFGMEDGLKKVSFPYLPTNAKLLEVGGNGHKHCYALFDNGYLYTWGHNGDGSCGAGHNNVIWYPTLVSTNCVKVWSKISSTQYSVSESVLAVELSDGYTYVTGNGNDGNFGLGNTSNLNSLTQLTWLGTNAKFVGVSTGYGSMMIYQKADGTIWAAGKNDAGCGFIGNSTVTYSTAVDITANVGGTTAGDVVYFHHGYRDLHRASSLLMRKDANGVTSMYTVGYNEWGQRGDGTTTASNVVYTVPNMSDVQQIVCTGGNVRSVYALKNNSDLYFWGHSSQGQSGIGTANVLTPTLIATSVSRILMRELESDLYGDINQMFIEKTDGSVWCSGENTSYYLGLGHSSAVSILTQHPYLTQVNQQEGIKFLGDFTTKGYGRIFVLITNSNNMYVWGYNDQNGISNHTRNNVAIPTKFNTPKGDL